jgi:hypothetical protein
MWLYKACIDCQPVASEICMQRISQQLIGDAVDMFPGFGSLEARCLDCLRTILGAAVPDFEASLLGVTEPFSGCLTDSYFEKEVSWQQAPAPTRSALSSLIQQARMPDSDGDSQ